MWLAPLAFVVGLIVGFALRSEEIDRLRVTIQYLQQRKGEK